MFAVLCLTATATARGGGGGGGNDWPGVYSLNRMLTFYLVNDAAQDFTVNIQWMNGWQHQMDTPVLVRVLNPDEDEVTRHFDPGLKTSGTPGWNQFDVPVAAAGAGVYQVIVTGFSGTVRFEVSPTITWGVYGYPFLQGVNHLTDAYVYLPPGLTSLTAQCQGTVGYLRLTDQNNVTHLNISGTNASGYCALPEGNDRIWHLTATAPGEFGAGFGVAPMIVCPDEATALAIRSSVDVLEDGTICYHKFQIQAHQLLQEYAAMDASAFAVNTPDLGAESPVWLADPTRNSLLIGQYGVYAGLEIALGEQNLDPASPWFGGIHAWHDGNGNALPNPWVTYDRLGLTDPAPGVNALAAVHAINDPINPLYHDQALRNRIIIAMLRRVMMQREHELPEPTWIDYDGGGKAFNFAEFARGFPWVIQQCPGNVQAVLTQAMRRYADHMSITAVSQIVNQWSFIMVGLQSFALGTGEQAFRDIVQMHINWLLTRRQLGYGAMPAGYFSEGEGPDGTYSGIHLHWLAWLAESTGSQPLKNALKESYKLLNHTIAPEPGGTWLGASTFAHRTGGSWNELQWTGGVGMMADDSADAAALLGRSWMPDRPARNGTELAAQQAALEPRLVYYPANAWDDPVYGVRIVDGPMVAMPIYEHYMGTPLVGQLPMKASDRFTRKFGNEFFAVRRPAYYAMLYSGKQFIEWRQPSAPTDPNVQYPRNGGGLSLLWSPKFGSSIIGRNWSAYSSNGLIATKGLQTFFEDYWQTTSGLQESQARATINGKLTDGKMSFRRQLSFAEDRILCEMRLQPQGGVSYGRLWECFPYPLDKPDAISVDLYDAAGKKIPGNNKSASAIVFRNTANEVHIIAFGEPRVCEVGTHTSTDAYGGQQETGCVLTRLPADWNPNQVRTVKWAARAVNKNQIAATIKQLVASLK